MVEPEERRSEPELDCPDWEPVEPEPCEPDEPEPEPEPDDCASAGTVRTERRPAAKRLVSLRWFMDVVDLGCG